MTSQAPSPDDLAAGAVAYADRHWLHGERGADWLQVAEDGSLAFGATSTGPVSGRTGDAAAASAVLAVGADIAGLVRERSDERITVIGDGVIAACVRSDLGLAPGSVAAPRGLHTAIDTTGDPSTVAEVCAALEPLGVLVLAGFVPARPFPWDLYRHVHKRGLRVIAAAPILHSRSSLDAITGDAVARLLADSPPLDLIEERLTRSELWLRRGHARAGPLTPAK